MILRTSGWGNAMENEMKHFRATHGAKMLVYLVHWRIGETVKMIIPNTQTSEISPRNDFYGI